ncbi:hypothetical protein STRTUCAR8_03673 [Streptomyces turgidiscabies Car8]|uniref:Uncharacterized protein n=1 Tax=Streptomyces turgidiscabies (strain Car8) TaxID=698760 RepID=L7ERG5_STRT8|nr:hypothetical protein STRTUCAR8_03673 [Streptomyces turgidiscabies Car8]
MGAPRERPARGSATLRQRRVSSGQLLSISRVSTHRSFG